MGNPITVTLSSVGTSGVVALDWMGGGPTVVELTFTSTTLTAAGALQYTLDDLMRTASSQVTWRPVSSTPYGTIGSSTPFTWSSSFGDVGFTYAFPYPVAGLRFTSSNLSSGSIMMDVLQGGGGWAIAFLILAGNLLFQFGEAALWTQNLVA